MSTLYVVATPLGNLGDITERALSTLKTVDAMYAEDTRVTRVLCQRYAITAPLLSYREAAPRPKVEQTIQEITDRLARGESVAYVSDAGTPGVSDPGDYLVRRVRAAGYPVVPIPGPSALSALLSVGGLGVQRPLFIGFLPHKKGRETMLRQMETTLQAGLADGLVLFESPNRLLKLLERLDSWDVPVRVCIGRELTKLHEEIKVGTPAELADHFGKSPVKGECVLLISSDLLA